MAKLHDINCCRVERVSLRNANDRYWRWSDESESLIDEIDLASTFVVASHLSCDLSWETILATTQVSLHTTGKVILFGPNLDATVFLDSPDVDVIAGDVKIRVSRAPAQCAKLTFEVGGRDALALEGLL